MPRKYQDGKLLVRKDVARPYWFVKVTTPRINAETGQREPWRHSERIGFKDEITRSRAMEIRAQLLERVNAHRTLAHAGSTFEQVAKRFLSARVPMLGAATQKKYKLQIENHLIPGFGTMKLDEIDRPAVEQFLTAKSERLGWWSRIDLKGILSAIFTAAKDWKLYEGDNPTAKVRIGRKKLVREKRLLSIVDLRRLLAALPERPKFIVLITFGLGLRISEVLGLRWSDIDFEACTITISRRWYRGDLVEQTKSEASAATMRLGPSLLAELQRRFPGAHKRAQFVIQGDAGELPPDDRDLLRNEFRPVLERLGLYYPGFGWHAFRRAHITYLQQIGGATPLEAMRGARHAHLEETYLYTLTDHERGIAQQQAMFDRLMETEGAKPS